LSAEPWTLPVDRLCPGPIGSATQVFPGKHGTWTSDRSRIARGPTGFFQDPVEKGGDRGPVPLCTVLEGGLVHPVYIGGDYACETSVLPVIVLLFFQKLLVVGNDLFPDPSMGQGIDGVEICDVGSLVQDIVLIALHALLHHLPFPEQVVGDVLILFVVLGNGLGQQTLGTELKGFPPVGGDHQTALYLSLEVEILRFEDLDLLGMEAKGQEKRDDGK